jgi:hypothetical protein
MGEEMNATSYQWRPATRGDIGSVARFGDTDSELEPWSYGILADIALNPDGDVNAMKWMYLCDDGNWESTDELQGFFFCQIQYDANQEP